MVHDYTLVPHMTVIALVNISSEVNRTMMGLGRNKEISGKFSDYLSIIR